jgi:hypothetical protein
MDNPIIESHNNLCLQCVKQNVMLCTGVRPYMRKDGRGVVYAKCHKLRNLDEERLNTKKIALSGLPKPVRDTFTDYSKSDVTIENGSLVINQVVAPNVKIVKESNAETPYKLVASLIKNQKNAKYVYSKVFFRWLDFNKLDIESMLGKDVEFVWVDFPELVSCPDYLKDRFYTAIESRLVIGLPTYIQVSETISTDNQTDKRFFELINRYK